MIKLPSFCVTQPFFSHKDLVANSFPRCPSSALSLYSCPLLSALVARRHDGLPTYFSRLPLGRYALIPVGKFSFRREPRLCVVRPPAIIGGRMIARWGGLVGDDGSRDNWLELSYHSLQQNERFYFVFRVTLRQFFSTGCCNSS